MSSLKLHKFADLNIVFVAILINMSIRKWANQ